MRSALRRGIARMIHRPATLNLCFHLHLIVPARLADPAASGIAWVLLHSANGTL
jgi:hypothetical protein